MFAIIETGGKQYKVEKGTTLKIEKLPEETGKTITFDQVLLISDESSTKVGKPFIDGAKVTSRILDQTKGEKITVIKKKSKKRFQVKQGHRQKLTVVEITDIKA